MMTTATTTAPRSTRIRFATGTHEKSGCPTIEADNEIVIVNASDRDWTRHRYVLGFGVYNWTRLMVYADSLEDALETAAEWLADHEPGHVTETGSDDYHYLMREVCEERGLAYPPPDDCDEMEPYWDAEQAAMSEHVPCDRGIWICPDWTVIAEDPSRADLAEIVA